MAVMVGREREIAKTTTTRSEQEASRDMGESPVVSARDPHELAEDMRRLRIRFGEFRGRL